MQFDFLVDLGTSNTDGPKAGFQECSHIGIRPAAAEYRHSNDNSVHKITGLSKLTDVTFKRGVMDSLTFYRWLNDTHIGNQNALRTVTVHLQNEDHTAIVQTWKLLSARIIEYDSGPMNAKNTDVVMEQLTLSYERIEME